MGHHHHHPEPDAMNWAFAIAVVLNFVFVVIQASYALWAGSMSLLADAGHNLGDVLGLLFAWGANWLQSQRARARYSYGYRRTTILAALANGLILMATSVLIARESIVKLLNPTPVHEWTIIIVALIGVVINGGTALLFLRSRHNDLNIKGAFLHLAADMFISLGVALTGVIILFTNWYWLDPMVGLFIVIAIVLGTWGLLRDSMNLILDAVPHGLDHEAVRDYLQEIPGVTGVHDLHIWGLSTREIALTAHLVMPKTTLTDTQHHQLNHELQAQFKITHITIQVETGEHDDPCGRWESC